MSEKIYPTIQESVDSLQDRINKVIGTQPQPVFDYYFCFTCQKKHHRQSICTAPLIAPMNRVTKEEFAEKYSGAQQAWCAYCNAFIEGNGWHLKPDCADGKIGAVKMAEEMERGKKENSLSPEAFGILLERIEKLERHYYSDGDLSAIHGQLENINKNNSFDEFERNKMMERIAHLEKLGTDHNLRKVYEANSILMEDFDKRLRVMEDVEATKNREFYLTEINKLNADRRNMNVLINHLSDRLEKIENTNPTQSTVDILMNGVENVGRRLDKTGELLADFIKSANGRMERLQKEDACLTTIIGKFREETWERVEGLEHELHTLETDYTEFKLGYPKLVENFIEMNVKNLHDRIDEICKNFDANRVIIEKKPHKCPVCLGNPLAELRITKTESGKDKLLLECHACEGKGVLWA